MFDVVILLLMVVVDAIWVCWLLVMFVGVCHVVSVFDVCCLLVVFLASCC